jgi:signal transduction histidine kinase
MKNIIIQAVESVKNSKIAFCKFISLNDAGETGAHQAGVYIPKNSSAILFTSPGKKDENLDIAVPLTWPDGTKTISKFKYYGKGSRNEYRITQIGKQLIFGNLFLLTKNIDCSYNAFLLDENDAFLFLKELSLSRNDTNQLIPIHSSNIDLEFPLSNNTELDSDIKEISKNLKLKEGTFKIRPAGRHLLTIGKDLIKDNYAAIVELVKNSYDADATKVEIIFSTIPESQFNKNNQFDKIRIIIKDDGHGMDYDTVINKWMVPSTDDKFKRKSSPRGRIMQGRKGIGRYASAILGNELLLETCSEENENTNLYIDWNEFEKHEYLDDVPVLIENFITNDSSQTILEITGDNNSLKTWTKIEIENLILELKKLIAPIDEYALSDKFNITLKFNNFPIAEYENQSFDIKPFPIPDLFDYRISGSISANGIAKLIYENKSVQGIIPEHYEFKINLIDNELFCGEVLVDFKVYDRDPDAIQSLIDRGLTNSTTNQKLGRNEAKNLLNQLCGIGIYRNGFRIRPYGEPGYDWLLLDKSRVQNPSFRIGSNQIIGYIGIQSEEYSHLEEKSARDGLKENNNFLGLIKIARRCLNKLEENRFIFRSKTGKGRTRDKTDQLVDKLFNLSDLRNNINREFENIELPEIVKEKVSELIEQKEIENNAIAEELKKKIAEYQGQVTLGKIVNVILHEGRRPFMYYTNHIPQLKLDSQSLKNKFNQTLLESIISKIDDIKLQSEVLVELFEKIDPLAAKRKDNKSEFKIAEAIETVRKVFEKELVNNNISCNINCPAGISYIGWPNDFYITLTNLFENSIYWLNESNNTNKNIQINVIEEQNTFTLDYYDNGIGIEVKYLEENSIFEPGFSTKLHGTGLGLAIAGEAMARNNCSLKAEEAVVGVHFIIESNIL